jgi:hypothetical protein
LFQKYITPRNLEDRTAMARGGGVSGWFDEQKYILR